MAQVIAPEFVDEIEAEDDAQDAIALAAKLTRLLHRPAPATAAPGAAPEEPAT